MKLNSPSAVWLAYLMFLRVEQLEGAVAVGPAKTDSKHPGQCMDEVTGLPYSVAASWQMVDTCGQATCLTRANRLYTSYETCGYTQASPPCYVVENLTQDFPYCCPRVICQEQYTNEIDIDDYSDYSDADELYMMSSYESPHYVSYDSVLPEEEIYGMASQQVDTALPPTKSRDHGMPDTSSSDYMVDWDTLFGSFY